MIADKAIASALGVVLVVSLAGNIAQWATLRTVAADRDSLSEAINDPETGYVARLATCRAGQATLAGEIDQQNASIKDGADRATRAVEQSTSTLVEAQRQSAEAQSRAADILSRDPAGANECERLLDLDRALVGSLK